MIKFKKLTDTAMIPQRQSDGAAGFDICATSHGIVAMGYTTIINTGIAAAIPPGYVGLVQPRSGLAFSLIKDVADVLIDVRLLKEA